MRLGRWVVFAGVTGLVALTALEGCSGGGTTNSATDVCSSIPACAKGAVPSLAAQTACSKLLNDATCGAAFKAMKECQTYRTQCTSSGSVSTSLTNTECRTEITAYNACTSLGDAGPDGCRVRTCSQANANCGDVDNGCGIPMNCGACANGQTCGGGGSPNRCGCACDPSWCGTLTACNTTVTCPTTCAAPQFCGGGGVANRCGCTPAGAVGPQFSASVTTAAISLDGGSQTTWSNATGARLTDTAYASASMMAGATTQYLVALSFGTTLPAGATVDGITVDVDRYSSAGLATADYAVRLVKGTQIQIAGDNKAVTALNWPAAKATATYGGPTDKWGSVWTAAEINAGGFGVAFAATYPARPARSKHAWTRSASPCTTRVSPASDRRDALRGASSARGLDSSRLETLSRCRSIPCSSPIARTAPKVCSSTR